MRVVWCSVIRAGAEPGDVPGHVPCLQDAVHAGRPPLAERQHPSERLLGQPQAEAVVHSLADSEALGEQVAQELRRLGAH